MGMMTVFTLFSITSVAALVLLAVLSMRVPPLVILMFNLLIRYRKLKQLAPLLRRWLLGRCATAPMPFTCLVSGSSLLRHLTMVCPQGTAMPAFLYLLFATKVLRLLGLCLKCMHLSFVSLPQTAGAQSRFSMWFSMLQGWAVVALATQSILAQSLKQAKSLYMLLTELSRLLRVPSLKG